jgi:adenylate cyclase
MEVMSIEIERKFLVDSSFLPKGYKKNSKCLIAQGYLFTDEREEIRVRRKEKAYFLTVKKGTGIARGETEIQLTRENFDKLWPLTKGKRIKKTRYLMTEGEFHIELDIYKGRLDGLVTAEVEFSSLEESRNFQPPTWFGRDVSKIEAYKNKNLAVHGLLGPKD